MNPYESPMAADAMEPRSQISDRVVSWWTRSVVGFAVLLVIGLVALFTFGQTSKWVGHTDLEIRFVVTESETGRPIHNASLHVRTEPSGLCDDLPAREFTLTTDESGEVSQVVKNCMCFGSHGAFEDTFVSHLPQWTFRATASGYSSTAVEYLDDPKNVRQVKRGKPFATLSVPIGLRKSGA
jgi:hypothetical protein